MLAKSLNKDVRPPTADAFPVYPASWYLFCESRQLQDKPFSQRILGRHLVAYRKQSGQVAVMDANCAHLGADLGCGNVVGETLQCPFHHWRYGADGVCVAIPHDAQIPAFARLQTYPVAERHGSVFFFNGPAPLFPLPFILGADPADFIAGKTFRYVADCNWYMNSAHAFDTQHFAAVHDRRLLAPPTMDCPAPYARRNSYQAEVIGHSIFDRILRVIAGRTVKITLTVWGGNIAVITAAFDRIHSGFLMTMQPLENGQTLCQGITYARRTGNLVSALAPFNLSLRRLFTFAYLANEARRLRGTRYLPASLGPNDKDMIEYFQWAASLPQSAPMFINSKTEEEHGEKTDRSFDVPVSCDSASVIANATAKG
jgi:nitrite reductase/ring-hydroxylating ferredoxin subunit